MSTQPIEAADVLHLGSDPVGLADVVALARGELHGVVSPRAAERTQRSRAAIETAQRGGDAVYGVTTGVGASISNHIPETERAAMPHHLLRMHGCGTGALLTPLEAAAVVTVRLVSLAKGHSGVRPVVLERLCELLERHLLPCIPEEGSVGASGDLTPLSYLGALVVGEREATLEGRAVSAADGLEALGLDPLELGPKESLALMNGTSVMSGLGALAVERAFRLARLASTLTATACQASLGNPGHFDERIFAWKPHPGSVASAGWVRADFEEGAPWVPARLQDRYSIRCAPHVIGVLVDAARQAREMLEIEINGANDNPLVDLDTGDILHGGNFYGGHVAFAMDGLKTAIANVADLLDRQLLLLCDPATNGGLPENLVAAEGADSVTHHGFKAMQISTSALCAEALKLTMPASAFSRSTESHNQDKVSMGTIAARDCRRVLELSETVAAIHTLAMCQAVDLRGPAAFGTAVRVLHAAVRKGVPMLREDRRQDGDIAALVEEIASGRLVGETPWA